MAASARVVIVGGGVTGLSTAYHLAQRSGVEVVLLEKGPVGDGSSTRAGGICTSQLWAQVPIQVRVIALRRFKELSEELPDYTYHDVGCLNLFDPEELELRLEMKKLWDQYGVANELLDADEMRRRWPALVIEDDIHGFLDERGGYSEPDEYVPALAAGCRRRGVDIREFTAISEPVIESGRCTGVRTASGVVEADRVLSATHAWSDTVLAQAGYQMPCKLFVHQRFVTSPMPRPVALPAVNHHPGGCYFRPADGNRMLLGIGSPDRMERPALAADERMAGLTIDEEHFARERERHLRHVDLGGPISFEITKIGITAHSVDGEPIMGPVPSVEGLFVAGCLHSGGFAYNPGAGYVLAEMLADETPSVDMSYYAADRFDPAEVQEFMATKIREGEQSHIRGRSKRH